jgi:AcrR family transcriptional regulator
MLDTTTTSGRIISAALRLAGERPWADVTLPDIAKAANVSLVELRRAFASKADVIAAFVRAVDDAVLERAPERSREAPGSQSPRDALFDVIMSRFDVLAPYKPALKSITATWPTDPALLRALSLSQAWMLRAAGIPAEGLEGQVKGAGLGALYASVFRTWLQDDDAGLARTMAALDRRLRRGESTLNSIDDFRKKLRGIGDAFANMCKPASPRPASTPGTSNEMPPAA